VRIQKEAELEQGLVLEEADLALIHQLSRKKLTREEVYAFCVRLCDNEVDRDGERFSAECLGELARLFVGKSGIFDHQWSAAGQTARIYRTELVREEGTLTQAGDGYCYLKGYAYLLRTEKNRDLIAEIEGGIKKEVSVGCAVERAVCSICGADLRSGSCGHVKGQEYEGKLCFAELQGATDAYEWSFVAVPAQRNAGVIKTFDTQREQLEREARLGRKYLAGLKDEVARLGALADPELESGVLKGIADKLEEGELLALRRAYEVRLDKLYPVQTQLNYSGAQQREQKDGAFLI
jgi:hypothetical protein